MTTKDIANLLKVSVRAVEMVRFRLRRRLELDKEENLVHFMMNNCDMYKGSVGFQPLWGK